jgi:hypothetical protein
MPELKRLEFRPVCRVRQLKMSHDKVVVARWKQTPQAHSRSCKPTKSTGSPRFVAAHSSIATAPVGLGWLFMSHSRTAVATSVTVRMNGSHLVEKLVIDACLYWPEVARRLTFN